MAEPVTRVYTVTTSTGMHRRLARLLGLLQYAGRAGTSLIAALSCDGDGPDRVKVAGIDTADASIDTDASLITKVGGTVVYCAEDRYTTGQLFKDRNRTLYIARDAVLTRNGEPVSMRAARS